MSPVPSGKPPRGPQELAQVTVGPKRIKVLFKESQQMYEIFPEDAPAWIKSGSQFIALNVEETKIVSARPVKANLTLKMLGFSKKEGEAPTPIKVEGHEAHKSTGEKFYVPESFQFGVLFEVVSAGPYEGYIANYRVPYAFRRYKGEDTTDPITETNGVGKKKCEEFLQVSGLDAVNDSIPWSDNVLPYLEKLLVSKNRLFVGEFSEQGYVNNLSALPDDIAESMRKPAPAKKAK